MSNSSLQLFCNRIVAAGEITRADVRELAEVILADGLACRDDADLLIALDRAVPHDAVGFADLLVALVVDFAVWGERPTGYIDTDTARWLAASLGNGTGPTMVAARIGFAVVQEAQTSDEHLIAFALAVRSPKRIVSNEQSLPAMAA